MAGLTDKQAAEAAAEPDCSTKMQRWAGRVALVTGASSGIGAAVAEMLVQYGMTVVGCARDAANMKTLEQKTESEKGVFHPVSCDLRFEKQILAMYDVINNQHGGLDVCINNAGMARCSTLLDGRTEDWVEQWQVNVLAPSVCTREAIKSMTFKGVNDGHIININSLSGHQVHPPSITHFYQVTKHAVTAMTKALRLELAERNSEIKQVSPGLVKTKFMTSMRGSDVPAQDFEASLHMTSCDISEAVQYILSTPPHVEIHEVMMAPKGQTMGTQ